MIDTENEQQLVENIIKSKPQDYILNDKIGQSYCDRASIYFAVHKSYAKKHLVVRIIDLERFTNDDFKLLTKEFQIVSDLRHPNIIRYYANFIVGQTVWLLQPFQHYGSCTDLMKSFFKQGFSEEIIAIILKDVLNGLSYLHSNGIIHRAVCARHFLIHYSGQVKLSGLRSAITQHNQSPRCYQMPNQSLDLVCWLAPEVLSQDLTGYTCKADIYSLGISALELATGEAPFAGLPVTEIMLLKLRGASPPLSPELPPDFKFSTLFSQLVDHCIYQNPNKRPCSMILLQLPYFRHRKRFQPSPLPKLLRPILPRLDGINLTTSSTYNQSTRLSIGGNFDNHFKF